MLNRVVLMGRLTGAPELRRTQSDKEVVNFCLAVERNYQADKDNRVADFINVVAWQGTAQFVYKYFQKGQLVALEGSLQTSNYEDKYGNKRVSFEVVADQVYFAEGKKQNTEPVVITPDDFEEFVPDDDEQMPFN